MEFFDANEDGFAFGSVSGEPMRLTHIQTYMGELSLVIDGETTLSVNGKTAFRSDAKGRFTGFAMDAHHARVRVPAQEKPAYAAFPAASRVIAVKVNGQDAPSGNRVELPAGADAVIELWY